MRDYTGAVEWLQRAARIHGIRPEADITIARELLEILDDRLDQPARALPHFARIACRYRVTRPAEWAARQMARLRTRAWTDLRDEGNDGLTEYQRNATGRAREP